LQTKAICGTVEFVAPEIVNYDPISPATGKYSNFVFKAGIGQFCFLFSPYTVPKVAGNYPFKRVIQYSRSIPYRRVIVHNFFYLFKWVMLLNTANMYLFVWVRVRGFYLVTLNENCELVPVFTCKYFCVSSGFGVA
jgi:hypothetical protein